ncbi:MAG: hypothetical protein EHM85_05855 [Desulfobacteraceae bacterium]|nr:MAG: hypothetical protein EHM85_05855 [Desulfobacteraceae bacterium]
MITEKLQEMVLDINGKPASGMRSEYDILVGNKKEKLPDIAQKESLPVQELQVKIIEPDIEQHNNYKPATEEAMMEYINQLNVKLGEVTIVTHWQIGKTINSFYQGKYGTNELGKISEATGIGRDTLAKACKFAKQYSKENLEILLTGNFVMSWTLIAPHLTVEPQKVIETYQISADQKQFYYGIIKLKSPSETRGKSKPPKIIKSNDPGMPSIILSEFAPDEAVIAEYSEPEQVTDPNELAKHHEEYEKELDMLKLENEQLKKEILSRDARVGELEKALSDVQREKERFENSYYAYMHKMEKIRAGLENNTPARAILEWMENGDEE